MCSPNAVGIVQHWICFRIEKVSYIFDSPEFCSVNIVVFIHEEYLVPKLVSCRPLL